MKLVIAVLSLSVILVSCSKQELVMPQATPKTFYKDANIAVSAMTATQKDASTVTVNFATSYETNIQKIEVMSGTTQNQLCTFSEVNIAGNSNTNVNYSVDDTSLKGNTMYYMLRYTLKSGDWGYTPLVSISIK